MKKARLPDGQIVMAHQYDADVHGKDLCCADPDCTAPMGYRKGGLTHGSQAQRSAAFVSRSVSDHRTDCTAHEDFMIMGRQKKSIEQGLREGKTIVINLNVRLTEDFNGAARENLVGQRSTSDVNDYVAVGARSVEDVFDYVDAIQEKGGQAALDKTRVNFKGKTVPLNEFMITDKEQYRGLLNKLYETLTRSGQMLTVSPEDQNTIQLSNTEITGFPRLIRFKATQNTRGGQSAAIRGTPAAFNKPGGRKLILLQKADAAPAFQQTLRGEDVHMIALPVLQKDEALAALSQLSRGNRPVVYLDIHWKVVSATQFTPVEPPAPTATAAPKAKPPTP